MRSRGTGVGARSRLLGAGVVAVAVLGLVAGCSGKEEKLPPWPTFSSPTAPQLTPTPKPTPPAKSALAREGTPAGAVEFVRWYLQAYEYAYAYGDPTPIRDVATAGCMQCRSIIARVTERKAAGQRVVGEHITSTRVAVAPNGTTKHTVVLAYFDVAAAKLVDASGKTVQVFGAAKNKELDIGLTWDVVTGWRVVGGQFK